MAFRTVAFEVFVVSMVTVAWPVLWFTEVAVTPSMAWMAVVTFSEHFSQVMPETGMVSFSPMTL